MQLSCWQLCVILVAANVPSNEEWATEVWQAHYFLTPSPSKLVVSPNQQDITWGNLSDLMQLSLETQKALRNIFFYICSPRP